MAHHVKVFEWLMYAALALGLLTSVTEESFTGGDIALLVIIVAVVAGVVWLAARKGSRVAAAVVGTLTVFAILIMIADLSGGKFLALFASEPPPSNVTLAIDSISTLLMTVAMGFYLFGGRRSPEA